MMMTDYRMLDVKNMYHSEPSRDVEHVTFSLAMLVMEMTIIITKATIIRMPIVFCRRCFI